MDSIEIVRELRNIQKKHENDFLHTFDTDISGMAQDCANHIEKLQKIINDGGVHGEWIDRGWDANCSICGYMIEVEFADSGKTKFCPECGAKMKEE